MPGLTVRILSRTIRPCRFQQGLPVDYDAQSHLSHDLFFAFDCMVAYSAMHDRVLFVAPLPAIHARQLWSFQVSSRGPGKRKHCSNVALPLCDTVAVSAVAVGPCNQSVASRWARSTLITIGIIYRLQAGVNTFFDFF